MHPITYCLTYVLIAVLVYLIFRYHEHTRKTHSPNTSPTPWTFALFIAMLWLPALVLDILLRGLDGLTSFHDVVFAKGST